MECCHYSCSCSVPVPVRMRVSVFCCFIRPFVHCYSHVVDVPDILCARYCSLFLCLFLFLFCLVLFVHSSNSCVDVLCVMCYVLCVMCYVVIGLVIDIIFNFDKWYERDKCQSQCDVKLDMFEVGQPQKMDTGCVSTTATKERKDTDADDDMDRQHTSWAVREETSTYIRRVLRKQGMCAVHMSLN